MTELRYRWERLMGRAPELDRFELWGEMHEFDLIRHRVLKTASKNQAMQKLMDLEHRLLYASSVMNSWYANPQPFKRQS